MTLFQRIVQLACLVGLSCAAQAQTCNANITETTPTADFVDNGDGTVTHSRTGLMWKRCAEGQAWSGGTCSGSATTVTWANALKAAVGVSTAGHSDWRLPNMKELESIVEDQCFSPSINSNIFPNTLASDFWSASADANNSSYAWYVNFGNGYAYSYSKSGAFQVRLVRSGQSFASFDSFDTVPLSVSKTGAGTVSGGAINCGSTCSGNAGRGFDVTLTASPAANLVAWGGACASAGAAPTCTLTMDAAKSVSASFTDTALVSGLPSALTFALQNIGSTSAAQSVTLTNSGTAALTFASIAASSEFGVTHNCGTGLGAGGFCTINVTFRPTASGARTGSVTVTSNATGSPHSIALSGTGQGGTGVLSASTRTFASQGVGTTSAAQAVTLSNYGVAALNIASIVASGDFAHTTTCSSTLAVGANCSISVSFSPTVLGARSGSVVITSDAANSPATVALSGTGIVSPVVSLNPTSLAFSTQAIGTTSAAQTATLTNTGGVPLTISSIASNNSVYGLTHDCGGGLTASGSCTLSVTYSPTSGAATVGSIVITSNAPGSPHSVAVTAASTLITRYRLYHDGTKEHLYTTDANEYSVLATRGWLQEGAIYQLYQGAGSLNGVAAVPFYRLYNRVSLQHHWTTDANEYNVLGQGDWTKEGVDGYILPSNAAGSIPVYRLYLNAFGGLHLWTTDLNEKNVLSTRGWVFEGVAGYVMPLQ